MKVPASKGHAFFAVLMLVAALAYLVPFVPRGWIPHDEGMLGQSAERVLQGGVPHVDYEESYTGGLTYFYAAVFKISGVDLLHLRWTLFAGAAVAVWLTYLILRRYLQPVGAALGTWVALAWSFPNYFAPIPSWWLLVCALGCLWAFLRYLETEQWHYVALAGLLAGLAVAVKQTGLYLLVALVMSVLYEGGRSGRNSSAVLTGVERGLRWGAAAVPLAAATVILAPRIFNAEGLYLFCPVAACAIMLLLPSQDRASAESQPQLAPALIVGASMALPLMVLLIPYLVEHRLWDLVYGAVILPRKRLDFAGTPMPSAAVMLTGLPMLALVLPVRRQFVLSSQYLFQFLLWAAAISLPILGLWYITPYQLIWQSTRALAALLPLAICYCLARRRIEDPTQRRFLFASASTLAWISLNQFPFAAPIYFCYVTPLALIAGVALCGTSSRLRSRTILPWTAMMLLFTMLSSHRAYIETLGVLHAPRRFDARLNLPRAHLKVSPDDVETYRRVVFSIARHGRGGQLLAGPDCPEVYFLSAWSIHREPCSTSSRSIRHVHPRTPSPPGRRAT